MKKTLLLFICFVSLTITSCADDKPIAITETPASAQKFIDLHFAKSKVVFVTKDKELFSTSYEVTFADGKSVEFDKKGEWTEVDCNKDSVPSVIIPPQIADYVTANYKATEIVSISRDNKDYEIELDNGIGNGLELKFDLEFNLIEIDN